MFLFPHSPFNILLFFNLILIKFECLSSKSFVVLRDEDIIKDIEIKENKDLNESSLPKKFVLKCPKTSKNISTIVWSHNSRPIFKINFTQDGTPEPILDKKNNPKWLIKAKAWHSIDKNAAMILTAKNNKYKVEIEIERKNSSKKYFHQWMVLRINKINIKEDKGVWSCQIFVNDERNGGRVKLEAESRKQITDNTIRPTQTKSREFLRRGRRTHQNDLSEEAWYLKQSEEEGPNNGERTFGFSKSDGNYAIFERSSIGAKPLESSLLPNYYDKIEYIRNIKESSELLGNKENAWRRRSKTAKNGGVQPVQLGLKLSVKIILLIIMLNILFF